MQNRASRSSPIELLRVISMMMIVACHFATHGGFAFDPATITLPRLWWNVLELGGNLGVDVFVLISGYFLVSSRKPTDLARILRFWGQVFFYAVVLNLTFFAFGNDDFGIKSLAQTIFPITFEAWWFASTYFVLYLLHPFLNLLLQALSRRAYQRLLALLLLFWCVIPTLTTQSFQSNPLLWFVALYCLGGYLRLFGSHFSLSSRHYFWFFALFTALRFLSALVLMCIGTRIATAAAHSLYFYRQQSILTLLSAVSLFLCFATMKMGYHKWINILGSATFGVYLIHDHALVRAFLWKTLFQNAQFQTSLLLIPYSLAVVALVYAVCTAIDLLRQRFFERLYLQPLQCVASAILRRFPNHP